MEVLCLQFFVRQARHNKLCRVRYLECQLHRMAAGADESTEQVVLELPNVRYNKRNGMLLLTSRRIAWAEELSPEYKITHQFCEIKSTH